MLLPSRTALVVLVALVAITGGFVLGLYALTEPGDRPQLLLTLVPALAGVIAGVPALLAWLGGQKLAEQNSRTRDAVDRVEAQTNGALSNRLEASNDLLREQLLAVLLPGQRDGAAATAALATLVSGVPSPARPVPPLDMPGPATDRRRQARPAVPLDTPRAPTRRAPRKDGA